MKVIFVHVYKTAGTSIKEMLERNYGPTLLEDYNGNFNFSNFAEFPKFKYKPNYKAYDMIIGHFPVIKYIHLKTEGWKFVTWLRPPMDRYISHYNYDIHHKEVRKVWGYHDDYLLSKYITERERNLVSLMLGNDIKLFDFIGFQDRMTDSILRFNEFLEGILGAPKVEFVNTMSYKKRKLTEEERALVYKSQSEDFKLYDAALKKFKWW